MRREPFPAAEDYDLLPRDEAPGADFVLRVPDGSMEPFFPRGSDVRFSSEPPRDGEAGLFAWNDELLFRQYHRDALGMTYLFTLDRAFARDDLVLSRADAARLVCFGRALCDARLPLPDER